MQPSKVSIARFLPKDVTIEEGNEQNAKEYDIKVSFEHAEAVKDIFTNSNEFSHLYTVEISPPTEKSPQVTSIRIGSDGQPKMGPSVFSFETQAENDEDFVDAVGQGDPDTVALKMVQTKTSTRMCVPLNGLSLTQEYVIRVCTVVNGHTIAKNKNVLKPVITPKETSAEAVA